MTKKIAGVVLSALLLAFCSPADAQQPTKIPRIGYLSGGFPSADAPRTEAFQEGLRELGYVEGKNILIEYRHAEGKLDRLSALAAELVRLKVDVIVTGGGGGATRAAKEATKTIPIVMAGDVDPVAQGSVTSLARPGGNVTGLSTLTPEISGKRLELLKEIVQAFPCRRPWDFNRPVHGTIVTRGGTCRGGIWHKASISRHAKCQRY